jgi:hypothetical protein
VYRPAVGKKRTISDLPLVWLPAGRCARSRPSGKPPFSGLPVHRPDQSGKLTASMIPSTAITMSSSIRVTPRFFQTTPDHFFHKFHGRVYSQQNFQSQSPLMDKHGQTIDGFKAFSLAMASNLVFNGL